MAEYAEATPLTDLATQFRDPPHRFGPIAFWFLNDHMDPAELARQLEAFAAAGFSGVCPCARVGLDPQVGYLTAQWFNALDRVMEVCRRLGLRVILYDEASYPSGSANGEVVAANPEHMARGLVLGDAVTLEDGVIVGSDEATAAAKQVWTADPKTTWTRETDATVTENRRVGYWRPTTGRSLVDRLVAVVAGQLDDQHQVIADSTRVLDPGEHHLIRLSADEFAGRWRLMALFDVPSEGTIRGAYGHNDDGSPLAPAAANLLDPAAVASFIRLTHDAYAEHLGRWFGDPIVAMFTDEPHILGRNHRRDARAWDPALLAELGAERRQDEVLRLLPSLFVPYDDDHGLAADHARVVADQLSRVYYGAQRQWCDEHGLALTGHPSAPDELTALDHFSWPGQDAVWRWVLPGPTALHGRESATARTAASAASARGIRTVLTEALGAYGWRLTMDEAKWLLDWHLVRGTTTFVLHAFFESVRGNRAFESEPDLGLHNAWWPHLDALTAHLRRAVMVLGSLTPTAEVAVVVPDDRAPVEEVAVLYEHQVTFDYLTPQQWRTVGDRYRVTTVIPAATIDPIWDEIREAGPARVLDPAGPAWWTELTDEQVRVREGRREDLRLGRWRDAEDRDWLMLVNEGEQSLSVDLGDRTGELWDLWTGQRWQVDGPYELGRRCSVVVAPAGASSTPPAVRATPAGLPPGPLGLTSWQAHRGDGQAWTGPAIGDWTTVADLETWSGSVRYRSVVELAEAPSDPLVLDLGTVGDLARVWVNGEVVADLAWAPYRSEVPATCWRSGENVVEVLVSNSSANAYEGAMRPSGLIGPVTLG